MSADDLDLEPLGRDDTPPTVDQLEALDRAQQQTRTADPTDERFVADMTPALELDVRDPAQARRFLAAYGRAERHRKATLRARRGAR